MKKINKIWILLKYIRRLLRNSNILNEGYFNYGWNNKGNANGGYENIGNCNSGYYNRGNSNTGFRNVGNRNGGSNNFGDENQGDENYGSYNSGCRNRGSFNRGSNNNGQFNIGNGYFNSLCTDKRFFIFDKETTVDITNINFPSFMCVNPSDPDYYNSIRNRFRYATNADIELVLSLPNFDYNKFEKIFGLSETDFRRQRENNN